MSFAQENLIEIILTVVPQSLRLGIPLGLTFERSDIESKKALTYGMIQKVYLRKNLNLSNLY